MTNCLLFLRLALIAQLFFAFTAQATIPNTHALVVNSEAIATAAGHVAAEYTRDHLLEQAINGDISADQLTTKVKAVAKAVGGAAAIITNKNISEQALKAATSASESVAENNSVKLVVTAIKVARKLKKLKHITPKKLKKVIEDEGLDILDDAQTIVDTLKGEAEPIDIALADADLALGTDLNNAKARAIARANKRKDKAKALVKGQPSSSSQSLSSVDKSTMAGGASVTKTIAPSLDDLSRAAGAIDKGGFTAAGRSLTKHGAGARPGNSLFPAVKVSTAIKN